MWRMANIIYLIYAVAYNIYNILVRNGYYKICTLAICKQTDVSHANRRHVAICFFVPVRFNYIRWCALRMATSGAHPPIQVYPPP